MNFSLNIPVKVIGGENCILANAKEFLKCGKKCVILTGKHSAVACGAQSDVAAALEEAGISYEIYNRIGPNPKLSSCHEAAELCIRSGAEFVVGIGGGSPLDAAKATAVIAANPGIDDEDFFSYQWLNRPLPTVLVGTTSGTGTEVSPVAILTTNDGRKRFVGNVHATLAFADAKYTHSMSLDTTITTGLDALAHAVEGFLSPKCDDFAAGSARMAIPVLWKHLRAIDGGAKLTDAMHDALYGASLWAGIVLNAVGTSFPHPFGYVLTEDYGVTHGRACTTFMPALLEQTKAHCPERVEELFRILGCTGEEFTPAIWRLSNTDSVRKTEEAIQNYLPRFEHLKHYDNVYGGFNVQQAEQVFRTLFLK